MALSLPSLRPVGAAIMAMPPPLATTASATQPSAAGLPSSLQISLPSEIFHCWMDPVMASRGKISVESLPRLPPEDSAAPLLARFRAIWERRRTRAKGDGRALHWTMLRLLSPRLPLVGLWLICESLINFSQPIIIEALVRSLRLSSEMVGIDFALVVLLTVATIASAGALQQVLWMGARVGLRAKLALSGAVYAKTIRLGNVALLQTSAGQATNLVAIDAARLEMTFTLCHLVWSPVWNATILGIILSRVVGIAMIVRHVHRTRQRFTRCATV